MNETVYVSMPNKILCFGYGIHHHFELATSEFAAQLFLVQNTRISKEFWHLRIVPQRRNYSFFPFLPWTELHR